MKLMDFGETGKKPSICILARKKLQRNTRVVRQAKVLSEAGYIVAVVSVETPSPEFMAKAPRVGFRAVKVKTWPLGGVGDVVRFSETFKWLRRGLSATLGRCTDHVRSAVRLLSNLFPLRSRKIETSGSVVTLLGAIGSFLGEAVGFMNSVRVVIARAWGWLPEKTELQEILLISVLTRVFQPPMKVVLRNVRAFTRGIKRILARTKSHVRKHLVPFSNSAMSLSFAEEAIKALGDRKWDYCQAHDSFALLAAAKVARITGARIIYDAVEIPEDRSGNAFNKTPNWLRQWESRRDAMIVRSAALVFSIGPALADWTAKRYGIQEPIIIRNCSLYQPRESFNGQITVDLGLRSNEKLGIAIGSLYSGCGIEQLIETIQSLTPEVHLAVLGVETERGYLDKLRELIHKTNVDDRFHILPPQPSHNVVPYAAGAHFGLIALQKTSLNHECVLPNKVFEMIMARLPIASSDLPNLRALLEEYGIGLVFNQEEPSDIARTINAILEPGPYCRYRKAVSVADKELCWEKEAERYIKAIEELPPKNA